VDLQVECWFLWLVLIADQVEEPLMEDFTMLRPVISCLDTVGQIVQEETISGGDVLGRIGSSASPEAVRRRRQSAVPMISRTIVDS
jgi:hypothetical protein